MISLLFEYSVVGGGTPQGGKLLFFKSMVLQLFSLSFNGSSMVLIDLPRFSMIFNGSHYISMLFHSFVNGFQLLFIDFNCYSLFFNRFH